MNFIIVVVAVDATLGQTFMTKRPKRIQLKFISVYEPSAVSNNDNKKTTIQLYHLY